MAVRHFRQGAEAAAVDERIAVGPQHAQGRAESDGAAEEWRSGRAVDGRAVGKFDIRAVQVAVGLQDAVFAHQQRGIRDCRFVGRSKGRGGSERAAFESDFTIVGYRSVVEEEIRTLVQCHAQRVVVERERRLVAAIHESESVALDARIGFERQFADARFAFGVGCARVADRAAVRGDVEVHRRNDMVEVERHPFGQCDASVGVRADQDDGVVGIVRIGDGIRCGQVILVAAAGEGRLAVGDDFDGEVGRAYGVRLVGDEPWSVLLVADDDFAWIGNRVGAVVVDGDFAHGLFGDDRDALYADVVGQIRNGQFDGALVFGCENGNAGRLVGRCGHAIVWRIDRRRRQERVAVQTHGDRLVDGEGEGVGGVAAERDYRRTFALRGRARLGERFEVGSRCESVAIHHRHPGGDRIEHRIADEPAVRRIDVAEHVNRRAGRSGGGNGAFERVIIDAVDGGDGDGEASVKCYGAVVRLEGLELFAAVIGRTVPAAENCVSRRNRHGQLDRQQFRRIDGRRQICPRCTLDDIGNRAGG